MSGPIHCRTSGTQTATNSATFISLSNIVLLEALSSTKDIYTSIHIESTTQINKIHAPHLTLSSRKPPSRLEQSLRPWSMGSFSAWAGDPLPSSPWFILSTNP
ncbi:hypothetical protein V3481_001551 [Fusarium oxysporum f. sp. vasinfectum]